MTTARLTTPFTHTRDTDTLRILEDADWIVRRASAASTLQEAARPRSAAGRPAEYPPLPVHGALCAVYEVSTSCKAFSYRATVDALVDRYTDHEMDFIGLLDWRIEMRDLAFADLDIVPVTHDAVPFTFHSRAHASKSLGTEMAVRKRIYRNAYQLIYERFQAILEPIDDTPLSANPPKGSRPTARQVTAAARNPALRAKTRLQTDVVNAIIAASLERENHKHYPGRSLLQGLLADHQGHIAIDETHYTVALETPDKRNPANYKGRNHAHSREHGDKRNAGQVGITLAVPVANPNQAARVPPVTVAAAIHHPTGGLGSAAVELMDAIDHHHLRPARPSNRNQRIVVDGGYTERKRLNENAHARGYSMVMRYAKNRQTIIPITPHGIDDDGDRIPAINAYNGRLACPGVSPATLRKFDNELPKTLSGLELSAHANRMRLIDAFLMPTNGRPVRRPDKTRGGQSKSSASKPDVMQVKAICPMIAGKARCPLFAEYDDPRYADLPKVPNAPIDLPAHKRPACCTNPSGEVRVNIPLKTFKTWQEFLPGSWEHNDWYTAPRAANESNNSRLKSVHAGGALRRGSIAPRKAAIFTLAVAFTIAATNRRIVESWQTELALNHGVPPTPIAHALRVERQRTIDAYLSSNKKGQGTKSP